MMRILISSMMLFLMGFAPLKAVSPFDGNGLFELMGLSVNSEPLKVLKKFLEEDSNTKFNETVWFSRKKGLEIGLKHGKVIRVFVHGKSPYVYGTKPFGGTYPLNIQYTDNVTAIKQRLGKPVEEKSWGGLIYYVKHRDRVFYTSIEPNEDQQSIKYVFIKESPIKRSSGLSSTAFGGLGTAIQEKTTPIVKKESSNEKKEEVVRRVGCVKGNCVDGIGTYNWESGSTYIGQFSTGKRTGFGTLYYENGDMYVGDWKENQKEGNGMYRYKAKGSLKQYTGEWESGVRKGFGYMLYRNGVERIANWDGKNYQEINKTGCIMGDCQNQLSEYVWADDGSRFVGKYTNGKRNGTGTYYYGKGGKYTGEFTDGKRSGKGTYYFANGNKYVGAWLNDKQEGYGILYQQDGRVVNGTWKKGQLISKN